MESTSPQSPQFDAGRVRSMPSKYQDTKAVSNSTGKLVFIVSVVLLVGVIIALIVFLIRLSQPSSQTTPVQEQTPAATQEPETPVQEDSSASSQETEDMPSDSTSTQETPTTSTQSIDLPTVGASVLPLGEDTDQDSLSDTEETIFLTNPATPDTDGDNFLDGLEVQNLYDPATSGALLEVSPQIRVARNIDQFYQLLVPLNWSALSVAPRGRSFEIQPANGSEVFRIDVYDNPNRLRPTEWYEANASVIDFTQFSNFSNEAGWQGIQSTDGTLVIATVGEDEPGARAFMYVMHYDTGTASNRRFATIWRMMLNSISITQDSNQS